MLAANINLLVQNVLDQVRGAWRFRWIALGVAWVVALGAWTGIFLIPDTYQASARVFVDTKTMLSQVTHGLTVDDDLDTQIQRVRQALIGGPQLQKVAEETKLVTASQAPRSKQMVLDKLREAIDISGGISRDSPTSGVYVISYKNRSRQTSLEVVDHLLNSFVQGTLVGKRAGSQEAQQFLVTQIADYEQRLSAAEQRLAGFKKTNVGLMPGAQGDYFTRLQAEMENLAKSQTSMGVAVRRRDELQRQMRGDQPFISAPGAGVSSAPAGTMSDTGTRIREAQAKLDDLLLRFTDKHPDVIALRQTLKDLEDRQAAELSAARRGDPGAADRAGLTANPVFQSIQLQYNQTEVEIAAIQQDINDRQGKIASLRSLMNTAPEVEAEFARLNRDYDVTRAQYHALLERLESTRLGDEAEAKGVVRFEVIDPPSAGFAPIAPKRPLLIVGAFLAALLAGAAVAYLLHLLKPVFLSARQLSAITGITVLGVVSMTWLEKYRSQGRRHAVAYVGAAAALLIVAIAISVLQAPITQAVRGLLT